MNNSTASLDRTPGIRNPIQGSELGPPKAVSPLKDYAVIQWETAAFYTYEAEVDGKPVPFGEPQPGVRGP
jgi:hypothetical protein